MSFIIASIVGGAAAIGGAVISSSSASSNSNAQIAASGDALNRQIAERDKVREMSLGYAQISPAEMEAFASMQRTRMMALAANERQVAQQEKILASIDPSIAEAGKQLYETLQGKAAAVLGPMEKQRNFQKAKLEADLTRRMGSGWRTSSAGIEAVTRFDQQTVEAMSQIQFQSLQQLGNVLSGSVGTRNNALGAMNDLFKTNLGMDQALLTNQDIVSKRLIGAVQGASQVSPVDYSGVLNASKTIGQAGIGLGGALINTGTNFLGQMQSQAFMKDLFGGGSTGDVGGGVGGGAAAGALLGMTGGSSRF